MGRLLLERLRKLMNDGARREVRPVAHREARGHRRPPGVSSGLVLVP